MEFNLKIFSIFRKRQHSLPFFLSLVLLPISPITSADIKPYLTVESFSYSEPFSIKDTFDGWEGDFSRGERQWTWNWLEAGVRYDKWGIGVLTRYDYDLRFTKDTAEAIGLINNKEDLPVGRTFDVELEANVINADAIRLSYRDQAFGVNYEIGVSYLYADYMMDGDLAGQLTPTAENDYEYRADVLYQYTEDILFDRPLSEDATGHGFALDLSFRGQLSPELSYYLEMRDLFARIYWTDLPYTDAEATSNRRGFDDDGYVDIDPAIQGFEGFHDDHTQKLDPRSRLKLEWQLQNQFTPTVDFRHQYAHLLYGVGSGYRFKGVNAELLYWPMSNSVSVNTQIDAFQLGLMVDDTDWKNFKTLMLNVSYNHL